ncbi:MAG: hypothetical protein JWL81_1621 [Verrucomicrobiales bacterium]|nr:hypothetical protein [Verrucomicrobiales bacterium]
MQSTIIFCREPINIPPPPLRSLEIGSILEFHGLVRELEGGRKLSGLFYEAHEPMARKRLEFHLSALQAAHPVDSVEFIHRLDWVPVGEASLYIRVCSSHRAEGLLFLSELVVLLKQDVPIWKLENAPGS